MVAMPPLKSTLIKASMVGAVGGAASLMFLGGMRTLTVAGGMRAPMALATAGGLALSSVGAAYAAPFATQALLKTAPGSTLSKIENLLLEPLMVGAVAIGVEALFSPDTLRDLSGVVGIMGVGIMSQVGAAYIAQGSGWTASVLG